MDIQPLIRHGMAAGLAQCAGTAAATLPPSSNEAWADAATATATATDRCADPGAFAQPSAGSAGQYRAGRGRQDAEEMTPTPGPSRVA